jgi:hypothetical protein
MKAARRASFAAMGAAGVLLAAACPGDPALPGGSPGYSAAFPPAMI